MDSTDILFTLVTCFIVIVIVIVSKASQIEQKAQEAEKKAARRAYWRDKNRNAEAAQSQPEAETAAPTSAVPGEASASQEETSKKEDEKPVIIAHIVKQTDYLLLYREFDKFADDYEDNHYYDEFDAEDRYYLGEDYDGYDDDDNDFVYSNSATEPLLTQAQFETLGKFVREGMAVCEEAAKRKDFYEGFGNEMLDIDRVGSFTPTILQFTLYTYLANDFFKVLDNLGMDNDVEHYATFGKEPSIDWDEMEGQIIGVVARFLTSPHTQPTYADYCKEVRMQNTKHGEHPLDMREHDARAVRFFHAVGNSVTLVRDIFEFSLPILLAFFKQNDLLTTMRKIIYDFTLLYAATRKTIEPHEQKYIDKLKRQCEEAEAAHQPFLLPTDKPTDTTTDTTATTDSEAEREEEEKAEEEQGTDISDTAEAEEAEEAENADAQPQEEPNPQEQLNELIGLAEVKQELQTLSEFVSINLKREAQGLKVAPISYHCVFVGNPGTGKTTVARILAGIYRELGVLEGGQLVETDRSGLVAEYVGQTAVKTNKIIDKALGGVLFIDEAYTLVQGSENDFGREAIATLLKRMEDDRDRLVVVLAGYNDEMEQFIQSNPGLRSRFNRYIHFSDYSAEELYQIFLLQLKKYDYTLAPEAETCLRQILEETWQQRAKDFGNARFVRNFFEKVIERQALRVAQQEAPDLAQLQCITAEDLQQARACLAQT